MGNALIFSKLFFLATGIIFILIFSAGIYFARDNPYLSQNYALGAIKSLFYEFEYGFGPAVYTSRDKIQSGEAFSVPVLLYHGIIQAQDGSNVPNENFKEQMFYLKKAGWQTITLNEFYEFMRGERKVPERSFVLTFDDGRRDSYWPVDPILRALDYKAVMFVITKYSLGGRSQYYLNEAELKQMQRSGRWEIHSHGNAAHEFYPVDAAGTKGHFFSNFLWLEKENRLETKEEFTARVLEDFVVSKNNLEERLGREVSGFAFPFGNFGHPTFNNREAREILFEKAFQIYNLVFYQSSSDNRFTQNYSSGVKAIKPEDFFVRRIEVEPDWDGKKLLEVLEKGYAKTLPYTDDFFEDMGWVKTWGELEISSGTLKLKPALGDTGSAVILDGSGSWKDYTFKAILDASEGSHVYIWARFQDDNNFVACNFGDDVAHIEQKWQGELRVIRGVGRDINLPSGDFEVAISVSGRQVSCLLNGEKIVETFFLEPELERGGVGIKSWRASPDGSESVIKRVNVEEIKPS